MDSDHPSQRDTIFYVEKEGAGRYTIRSAQLEQIGERLRGKSRFSVFNSILLPLVVSVATIVLSSLFQYVSWINSVRLQNANDIAAKAVDTYSKVDAVMGQRRYASLLFSSSLQTSVQMVDRENPVGTFDFELRKRRFNSYYNHLREWNEQYDRLLTDIDYDLDRPLFSRAGLESEGVRIFNAKISKINCTLSLPEQLEDLGLNKDSLKLRFAGINHCFIDIHKMLSTQKNLVTSDSSANLQEVDLGAIQTMGNEFRCHALRRIDYYNRQKERSILSPFMF
jgi:hypothetical protein